MQPAVSTPLPETGIKGGSHAQKPANLDNHKGKIHSEKLPNNTKDPESTQGIALGVCKHLSIITEVLVVVNCRQSLCAEKTQNTVWEENGEVANDEPAVQENGWGTWTPNASTSAWSYRALRSSALGPTLAHLRGKNTKRGRPYNRKYGK